ncbi:MAG: 30S ribosomal protein S20, partial [Verrucomicrobiota bacterium]|nr:30S ribosomal protein S20 [Verrucomicrobiota bacterium]
IALCGAAYFSPKFKFSIPHRAVAVPEFSRLVKLALRIDIKNETHALISALDKAAKRGIIHRNAANPGKARLNRALSGAKKIATLAAEPQQPRKIPAG